MSGIKILEFSYIDSIWGSWDGWVFGWVVGCFGGYGVGTGGVYIVLFQIGLVYLDLNFLIPLILVLLILVPLHTVLKISSTHLMQFFKLNLMVQTPSLYL